MKKLITTIAVGIPLLIIGALGVLFYTSVPLKVVAKVAKGFGCQVTGVGGSLATGFKLAAVDCSDEYTDFKVENVNFEHSGFWEQFVNRNLIFEDIEIGSAVVNIKKHRPNSKLTVTSGSSSPDPTASPQPAGKADKNMVESLNKLRANWKEGKGIRKFAIKKLRFANMKVSAPELPMPIELSEYLITNLTITPDRAHLETLKIISTFFDLSIQNAELDGQGIRIALPATGTVKTTAWKGLKKDFSLSIQGSYEFATQEGKASLVLFDDHLKAHLTPGSLLELDIRDLTLSDYLENAPAISRLNLHSAPVPLMSFAFGAAVFQGDFGIGEARFVIPTAVPQNPQEGGLFRGVYEEGPLRYEASIKPNIGFITGQSIPWVQIRTNQRIGAPDLLAHLYYKKPFIKVTDLEKPIFAQVSSAYTLGEPLLPIYSAPAPPQKRGSFRRSR